MFTETKERLTSDLPCNRGWEKKEREWETRMQREKQKNGDARGYMIAEQTHKSSINPRGVKEALFSFSRQPSQTEHHHKPSFLASIFFLIFRACTHTLSHSPPFFPSFPTYLFLFLQIFYPSVLSPSQWITDKNKKRRNLYNEESQSISISLPPTQMTKTRFPC